MWVVKLGGSLNQDALLPDWLDLLVQLGGGRVTLVCGGGTFADAVRKLQSHWQFDDLAAHNMAVLAMVQTVYLARALQPQLHAVSSEAEIRQVLRGGHTAVWMPLEWLHTEPGENSNWDISSDSIALDLACKLNAERLVVVKSCPIARGANLAELSEAGILDRGFPRVAEGAGFPIDVVQGSELARVRKMLLGDTSMQTG